MAPRLLIATGEIYARLLNFSLLPVRFQHEIFAQSPDIYTSQKTSS